MKNNTRAVNLTERTELIRFKPCIVPEALLQRLKLKERKKLVIGN